MATAPVSTNIPETAPAAVSIDTFRGDDATTDENITGTTVSSPISSDKLSQQIASLWANYKRNRKELGSALPEKKEQLRAEGDRNWCSWLEHMSIPRASAERLIAGFERYLAMNGILRNRAEDRHIDLTKPAVQRAYERIEADVFEAARPSEGQLSEWVRVLEVAAKPMPRPSKKSVRTECPTQPQPRSDSDSSADLQEESVSVSDLSDSDAEASPEPQENTPTALQVTSYIRDYLGPISDQRDDPELLNFTQRTAKRYRGLPAKIREVRFRALVATVGDALGLEVTGDLKSQIVIRHKPEKPTTPTIQPGPDGPKGGSNHET